MKQTVGIVKEIFIPNEYKNGKLIDVMESTKIGFKILVKNILIEIIQEQNEFNAQIMVNDQVLITSQNISNQDFLDIELYNGDNYE